MIVLEADSPRPEWGMEVVCSGAGNGGGGCLTNLWVQGEDLFYSPTKIGRFMNGHLTIECSCCGTWTDIKAPKVPMDIAGNAKPRSMSDYQFRERKSNVSIHREVP